MFYFIDTDEIPGFFLLLKNHIFIARCEDTIFIFHVWGYWCRHVVLKVSLTRSLGSWGILSALEDKIRIPARPCNILYLHGCVCVCCVVSEFLYLQSSSKVLGRLLLPTSFSFLSWPWPSVINVEQNINVCARNCCVISHQQRAF